MLTLINNILDLEKAVIGGIVAILIYFVKNLMAEHNKLKTEVEQNKTDILLLKQETHSTKTYFNEKFEVLFKGIEQINSNIQKLNEKHL